MAIGGGWLYINLSEKEKEGGTSGFQFALALFISCCCNGQLKTEKELIVGRKQLVMQQSEKGKQVQTSTGGCLAGSLRSSSPLLAKHSKGGLRNSTKGPCFAVQQEESHQTGAIVDRDKNKNENKNESNKNKGIIVANWTEQTTGAPCLSPLPPSPSSHTVPLREGSALLFSFLLFSLVLSFLSFTSSFPSISPFHLPSLSFPPFFRPIASLHSLAAVVFPLILSFSILFISICSSTA